jgi:hypothetical protein
MNLADSIKKVLKNRNNSINLFLKEDLKAIVLDFKDDWVKLLKDTNSLMQKLRQEGLKPTLLELGQSIKNLFIVLKYLPTRIFNGLNFFKTDFLEEIENCQDQKEKTLLSLKVLGALTHYAITSFYEFKKGNSKIRIKGLGPLNTVSNIIIAELVFKITSSFILRLFEAIEAELSVEQDKKHFIYFKQLIMNKEIDQEWDNSVIIVEKFKKYVMTGER